MARTRLNRRLGWPCPPTTSNPAHTNEEAEANIKAYLERAEAFWAEQATAEQREMRAELNDEGTGESGENLWHYLDEAQQRSLLQELQGDGA
jgi:hypothetical protein